MTSEQEQIESALVALEGQRGALGDLAIDAMMAGLRTKLASLQRPAVLQRRQVTVLFADVVGSTAMAQGMDAEDTLQLLSGALQRMAAIVEAHQGRVLRFTGDGLKAAFGMDAVREDDTERAVHAGLAMLQTIADCALRVGLHTGDVALGAGVEADNTAMGAAVNIAARMEQTAPPGTMRISHDTYAQVRGLFEVDAQPPLLVKGVDASMHSYLVRRAKPRQFRIGTRGIEGVATRMVGRDAELQMLQAAFERVCVERTLAAVTVVANAGIGKSRLLAEFAAWSEARPEAFVLLRGRATPQTGTQAFGLLRDIIAWRFQILDDDSIEAARRKMEVGVVPLFLHDDGPDLAEGHAHLLGHLIGIEWRDSRHLRGILDDPRQIRNRALHAATQLFRRLGASTGMPVVLELEDLHWADDESLDFLNQLADVNRDLPLLLLAFTRPALFERRSHGCMDDRPRIDLQPLDKPASRDLASELLKKLPDVPAALRELLTSSAEGNPFYMEELVKMLIDQGAIQTGDPWTVNAERLVVTQVPPTLTGVLQARLDSLPAPEKRALQQASVVGAVFWDQALAAIEPRAAEQLAALVQRQLTLPRAAAALDGLREYAFHHQLLYQVTYDTVLKRDKREGHAKVAQWLAGLADQGGLRSGDVLGLAAEHFERAGDAANAAEFHARAAEQAGQRQAHERVLAHVGRALVLLGDAQVAPTEPPAPPAPPASPAQAELRWRLLIAREMTLSLQARRDEQAADLDALEQLAEALDNDRRRAVVAYRRGMRAAGIADWAQLECLARHGLACAARAGDDGLRLNALWLLARAERSQSRVDAGRALALRGLDEARRLGLHAVEARLLNELSAAAGMQDDLVGVLELNRQALQINRKTGNRLGEAVGMANLGGSWINLGDLVQARRDLDAALQMLRANGDRVTESMTLIILSLLALWQGQEARALALVRQALDIAVAAQARVMTVVAGLRLGDAELALGRVSEARQAYTQAHAGAREIGSAWQHDASASLARVALAEGDAAAALAALQPLLAFVAGGGTLDGTEQPRLIELTCHQTLARAGDPAATEWLARAHTALMAQADAISDATLRHGFLHNIPHHREIVSLFSGQDVEGTSLTKLAE